MDIALLLLFQLVLIALNAIFASAEIAVLSVSEAKLEKMVSEGNGKAKRLWKLTREPAKFLATIQVAITLSGFLGSAFAAENFSGPMVEWVKGLGLTGISDETLDAIAVVVITLILSYVTLIFGELVPKRLAMKKSEKIAMGISGLVGGIAVLFRPIVWFLSVSTNLVLRMCGIDPNEIEEEVSEEEIRLMVDAGSEKGTIDHQEKELIQNIFEFNDITAGEITVHRTEVNVLWLEDEVDVWEYTIHENRHTLYPVCDGSADNVIGILNAKDYFRLEDKSKENILANAVHEPYFVPETIKADVLFCNMKQTRNSMAVVLDEYGGMEGIVTIFDLVEELVGEIDEEPENANDPEPHLNEIGENKWEICGSIELKELEEVTGLELVTDEYDTLTGLVFAELGAVPADGEQSTLIETDDLIIEVKNVEAHQIELATVKLKEKEEIQEDED